MYFIQHTALVLLLHRCIVSGFDIFDMGFQLNDLSREINSKTTSDVSDSETKWILQELDHFNSSDKRTWQMKYLERLNYWRDNGPIYLFLDHYPCEKYWLDSGIMKELAEETNGAMFVSEFRYQGDSKPFKNVDVENIKYFTSRQIIADVAKLISHLKSLPMYKDSKVVVVGRSGNMATWMKVLYPELVDAAISSSARVLAQKDSLEVLVKLKNNFERYGGQKCLDKILKTLENYDLLLQSPEGIEQLKKAEHICDSSDMTSKENQQLFFFLQTSNIYFSGMNVNFLNDYCAMNNNKNINSRFLNEYLKVVNSNDYCLDVDFQDFINYIKDQRNHNGIYTALYSHCTEIGQFPTTSSKNQPFLNIPLEFYIKVCSALYGNNFNEKRVDEGIGASNKLYGGLKPNVTKVIFTNGELDLWSSVSVLKDLSHDAPALVIPRASPGIELFSGMDLDSEELKEARAYVKYLIKKWIGVGDYLN